MQPTRWTFEDKLEELVRDYADLLKTSGQHFTEGDRFDIELSLGKIASKFGEAKMRILLGRYGAVKSEEK